jgi:E3 ubiquitin-protein ligase SHPRH
MSKLCIIKDPLRPLLTKKNRLSATGKVGECRKQLRLALELQHKAVFFCANAYFQIKSNEEMTVPDSDEFRRLHDLEVKFYEDAKALRREILYEVSWQH